MKFATKLITFVLGVVITFAVIVSYVVYTSSIKILRNDIKNKMEDTAAHVMDKLDRMLFERSADIKVMASDPVISSKDSTPKQITERLYDYRNYFKTYVSLSFFDLNRIRIADTAGLNIGRQDKMHKYWEHVLRGEISIAADISFSESLLSSVIYFAYTVKDENGQVFCVAV